MKNLRLILIGAFYTLFILIIGYIFAASLISESSSSIYTLPIFILFIAGSSFTFFLISKYKDHLEKHYKSILFSFLGIMFMLQVIFGFMLRFTPAFDMDAIYGGAIEWVNTGTFESYYDYYYYFPNNLGGMSILFIFFKLASIVGIKDFFAVGMVINSLLSVCTMLVCSLTAKKLAGTRHGILILSFFMLSLPFYFIAPAFYTDSLSLIFPIIIIYLALILRDSENTRKNILLSILIGLSAAIGMLIKFTVVITVIAVLICLLINKRFIKAMTCFACAAGIIAAVMFSFNSYMSSEHLTDDLKAYHQNTPYTHWIMMGLKGSGEYNGADYAFTRSFADPIQRDQAINEQIKLRVSELGAEGLLKLWTSKGIRSMGNGTYALSDFLDDNPSYRTYLHTFVLYSSEHYKNYNGICGGVHLGIMFFTVLSAIYALISQCRNKAGGSSLFLAPHIAVIGITLFLLIWETSGRYITNYLPIFFICASFGPEFINKILLSLHCKHKNNIIKKSINN